MPLITDTLTDITGELTEYDSVMVRSNVRAGSTSLITPETREIPVVEGEVSFHAEPGAGMLILRREKNQYSRQEIIPIWVPEYDTTFREAMELGKTHQNMDGDTAQDLVEQLLETITGAVADGLNQIEEAIEGFIIGDDGISIDLSDYATTVYVDEQIAQIELIPGQDGKDGIDGIDGKDGKDGKPGASAYEMWLSAGNTGTETEFLSSLKGEPGKPGREGQDGQDGVDGQDGISPHIDKVTGNWHIGDTDTGIKAQGRDGVDGKDGQDGVDGEDGLSPHIDQTTGNWVIGTVDTGVKAQGQDGNDGQDGQDGSPGASAYEVWLSAGNTGTEADFLSSLKGDPGQDGQDGQDGDPGDDGLTPHIDQTTGNWHLGDQDTGVKAQGLDGQDGQDGVDGKDGLTPHIDQISGNWHIGDTDTGVKAQGPKGDPGDGSGGGTSAVLKTTLGFPQDTEGVEPGEIRIETFSGLTFRAKGSFGMIPADMAAVYPVGQDPTGMPGLEQLPAGMILTDDGTNFWQLQTGGEVKEVEDGDSTRAQTFYGYGTIPPGTAFKIDRDDDPDYPAGLYLISDVPPVTRWEQFTMSPDAPLTYMVNLQNTIIQGLESRIEALENPTE